VLLSEVLGQFSKVEQQLPPGFQIGPEAAFSAGSVSSLFAAAIASVPNMPRHQSKSNSNSRNQFRLLFHGPGLRPVRSCRSCSARRDRPSPGSDGAADVTGRSDPGDRALEEFDFCWSSSSLEHLGTLQNGINFVINVGGEIKLGCVTCYATDFQGFFDAAHHQGDAD
jgi:hypothetical protein